MLSAAINLEKDALDEKGDQMSFSSFTQTGDYASPVTRSLQFIL